MHSVTEYFDTSTVLFLLNMERLTAQEELTRKEYAGVYRNALREMPVPPPEASLNAFSDVKSSWQRVVESFALKDEQQKYRLSLNGEPPRSFLATSSILKKTSQTMKNQGRDGHCSKLGDPG